MAHLDHGAFGATPASVQRAQQRVREEIHANPSRALGAAMADRVGHTRRHLASFVGADPDGCALVPSVDAGIAMVLRSLDLGAGDEILTVDTCRAPVTAAVGSTCRETGATHRIVSAPPLVRAPAEPEPERALVATVTAGMNTRTRLVVVDHVVAATARWQPVDQIVTAARRVGAAVLVDGTGTPGSLAVAVSKLGADFWVGDLHTWAFAPRHTVLLAVAPVWRERLRPLVAQDPRQASYPGRVEALDLLDVTAWLAAPAGVFALRSLGSTAVREHNGALAAYGQAVVARALGLDHDQLPGSGGPVRLPVRVVPLPAGVATSAGAASALQQRIADELATEVTVGGWRGGGLLRLSAQVYNLAEEYDRLADRLPGLLRRTG